MKLKLEEVKQLGQGQQNYPELNQELRFVMQWPLFCIQFWDSATLELFQKMREFGGKTSAQCPCLHSVILTEV